MPVCRMRADRGVPTLILFSLLLSMPAFSGDLFVQTDVEPYVVVSTYDKRVNIGSVATAGDVKGSFSFYVESNANIVILSSIVTHLYKDNDPASELAKPIRVKHGIGMRVEPEAAEPINGASLFVPYAGTETYNKPEGLFEGYKTIPINLKSTQSNGLFSQDIALHTTWTQDNQARPAGTYGGYVVLYVMVSN